MLIKVLTNSLFLLPSISQFTLNLASQSAHEDSVLQAVPMHNLFQPAQDVKSIYKVLLDVVSTVRS